MPGLDAPVLCRRMHGHRLPRMVRSWSTFALVAALSMASTAMAPLSTQEYQVKAAFLLSFVTFTEWPATAFETPSSPLRICVVGGADPFEGSLSRILQGESVAGHPLVADQVDKGEDLARCHVLFVPRTTDDPDAALEAGTGFPVLLVGESDELWQRGAIISFAIDEGRVRFDVDRTAAQRNGLQLSSKLLRIARLVR